VTPRRLFPGLRRTLAAPWLILGIGVAHLALAAAVATPVRAAYRAAMGPYFHEGAHRLLTPLLEITGQQRAAPASILAAMIVTAVVAALVGPLLAGAAIQRLASPCKVADQARAAVQFYPASLLTGVYGVILRALLLLIAAALGQVHFVAQLLLTIAALTYATAVVDLTRATVILTDARPYHPRTFLRAAATVAQQPLLWLRSSAASLVHVALLGAIVLAALHGFGAAWSPWAVRGLGLLATCIALARVAVAVDHVVPRAGP
jgi:hypothetical protein